MMEIELAEPVRSVKIAENLAVARIVKPYHSGKFVSVRPVSDNPEDKTYFGIMLGDMNIFIAHRVEGDSVTLSSCVGMPGIFIPALAQITYGPECFWKIIKSLDQLTEITDLDLEQWGELLKAQITEQQALIAQYADKR